MQIDEILILYRQLLGNVDQWFSHCLSAAPETIHCAKGCSSCCRGLFDITLLDASLLRSGFETLEPEVKNRLTERANARLTGITAIWPEFGPPYTLNHRSDEEWHRIMPENDETPCLLLDDYGQCLLYAYRPMTCRLHGIPVIDVSGDVVDADVCTLNLSGSSTVSKQEFRFEFNRLFQDELTLFKLFTEQLLEQQVSEVDTLIPAAILLSFDSRQWIKWRPLLKINHQH